MMSAGQWVQQVTLGWLLYDLTGNSMLLGALNGLRALPFLVTGPMAGVAADRMDRRKLLLGTQWVLIATAILFGALVASPFLHVWHIFLFTLITGVAWTITEPVRMSVIPSVVPKAELANAVALNSGGFNLMKVIGPALGGALIAWFGAAENFFLQAAAYIGVLGMIYRMHIPPSRSETKHATAYANLKEGFAYVWHTPAVLALMTLAYVPRVFAVPYQTLMPVFQKDVLKIGPDGLGLLMAAPGIGAVIAVVTLASLSKRIKRQGLFLLASIVVLGFFLVLFSANHLVSTRAGHFGDRRRVSNVFSRQHGDNTSVDRAGWAARARAQFVHARPRFHAPRRAVRRRYGAFHRRASDRRDHGRDGDRFDRLRGVENPGDPKIGILRAAGWYSQRPCPFLDFFDFIAYPVCQLFQRELARYNFWRIGIEK